MPHSDPPSRRTKALSSTSTYRTCSYGAIPQSISDNDDVFMTAAEREPLFDHRSDTDDDEPPSRPRPNRQASVPNTPRLQIKHRTKFRSETLPSDTRHARVPTFIAPPYLFPSMTTLADIEREEELMEEKKEENIDDKVPPLTKKQKITMVMMAFANFASTVAFSLIAPFFPTEAKLKGATQSQIGIVFGIFEFCMFLFSPLLGRYMSKIGSKFMFTAGLFVCGVTAILFGTLNWSPSGTTFLALALTVRIVESVGDAAFLTASFAITAHSFPGRISRTIGILEVFSGLGFTAGPPIGGALYQLGGYGLPFFVLGGLLIVASGLSLIILDNFPDDSQKNAKGVLGLVRTPSIMLMVSAITVCAMSLSFLDPTLAPHLAVFHLSPFTVGLIFLCCGGVYTLTAPIYGYLIDRRPPLARIFMIFGALFAMLTMLFLGPSPIFGIEKQLWLIAVSLSVMGLSIGALFIPTFQTTLEMARESGYPDSIETYGCVSGLFQSCFSFGGFFGPTVGGVLVEAIGFGWTGTIIAALHLCVAISLSLYYIYTKRLQRKPLKAPPLVKLVEPDVTGVEESSSLKA